VYDAGQQRRASLGGSAQERGGKKSLIIAALDTEGISDVQRVVRTSPEGVCWGKPGGNGRGRGGWGEEKMGHAERRHLSGVRVCMCVCVYACQRSGCASACVLEYTWMCWQGNGAEGGPVRSGQVGIGECCATTSVC
jgi:hypothetical protein